MLLSVILPNSQETELTEEWCRKELKGIDHEIIVDTNWSRGFLRAKGEFISFLEADCVISEGYFKKLLEVFKDKPSYRKLAMVTPVLGANSWTTQIFGYLLSPTSIMPSRIRSSSELYLIQIGFIPGAIIRRTSLVGVLPKNKDVMMESVNLSVFLWENGQRVALNPEAVYVSADDQLDLPYHVERQLVERLEPIITMWKRELIG